MSGAVLMTVAELRASLDALPDEALTNVDGVHVGHVHEPLPLPVLVCVRKVGR